MNDSDVGHFTKDCIPLMKALMRKRWAENNPICVESIPVEYMIRMYGPMLEKIFREELKSEQ